MLNLNMVLNLIFTLFLNPNSLQARPTCNADTIVAEVCNHFKANDDQSHIKTSDGGLVPNPYFIPRRPVDPSQTTYSYNFQPHYEELINADLAFQIDAESILKNSNAKIWSNKSMKLATNSQNLGALLAVVFPKDTDFSNYKSMPIYFPANLSDSDSSVVKLNDSQILNVIRELGPETLQKLKDRFSTLPKMTMLGGGIVDAKVTDPTLRFQRIRKSTVAEDQARQKELTLQAKRSIIEMIKNGRSDDQLTSEQRNLIGRITSVEVITADMKEANDIPDCSKQQPQAFFVPTGYNIILCENLLDLPDATMLRIIAHELGHSIDPCTASCDHLSANQEKIGNHLEKIKSAESDSDANEESEETELTQEDYYHTILEGLESYGERPFITYHSADTEFKDKLIKEGFVQKNFKGIPRSQQPFDSVRSCLIKNAGFDNVSTKDIAFAIHQRKDALKRFGKKMTKKEIADYENYYKKNADCMAVGNKMSQMSESMADVYAAYALSNYLKDNPPKTQNDKYAIEGIFLNQVCDPYYTTKLASQLKNGELGVLEESHPLAEARTKNILLQFPGITTQFDCDFKKSNRCFDRFQSTANQSVPKKTTTKGAQE